MQTLEQSIGEVTTAQVEQRRSEEELGELKTMVTLVTSHLAMPLYMIFWLCDLLYAPDKKWLFLGYRTVTVLFCAVIHHQIGKAKTFNQGQRIALAFTFVCSLFISVMALQTEGPSSPYYAGLNLACAAMLLFFPFDNLHCALAVVAIYGVYFVGAGYQAANYGGIVPLLVNSFFITGTVIIALVIRHFHMKLRRKEVAGRLALEKEIAGRDVVIKIKTGEAINLAALSSQFSPQVVQAIRQGTISLRSGVHRSNICVAFIDVVNSTERVIRLDKEHVNRVVGMFMDDTIRTLLKYDITIDKFLGDGVLAFSNDPIKYDDYIERVLKASLEIRQTIKARGAEYQDYWLRPFEVRIGISHGFANVGFYGNNQYFRTYTAIGPAVNLASRLVSAAEPNQILVSREVIRDLGPDHSIEFKELGEKTIRGFESDVLKIYEVVGDNLSTADSIGITECPKCASIMYIDSASGFYVFKCRQCGHVLDPQVSNEKKAA